MILAYIILASILMGLILFYRFIPRFFNFAFNSKYGFIIIVGNVPIFVRLSGDLLRGKENVHLYSAIFLFFSLGVIYILVNKYFPLDK